MFEALSDKLNGVFDRLRSRGTLNEMDVTEALREVRLALLDADVALPVVRDFITKVRERAIGVEVLHSVTPGQQVVKIVNDVMIEAAGRRRRRSDQPQRRRAGADPAGRPARLRQDHHRRQARAAASGAAEARRCCSPAWIPSGPPRNCSCSNWPSRRGVPSLPIIAGQTPVQIAQRAMDTGRREGYDIVLLDTAGRLSIDEALMAEVRRDPRRHQPGGDAAGGRCDDRPGRGQHRQGVQRRASASPASC